MQCRTLNIPQSEQLEPWWTALQPKVIVGEKEANVNCQDVFCCHQEEMRTTVRALQFIRFFLHNCFKVFFFFLLQTLQLKDWICIGANSSEMNNKVGRWRWGYHYLLFPAYTGATRDQLSIGRHPHKDLKWTELCLGPIQRRLEAFLGFLVKTKMKAYWLL